MTTIEESIKKETGHVFKDKTNLKNALTHPAYERLEFLGDRVLNIIMADLLFHTFPRESEGDLAKRHAYLVSAKVLTEKAKSLDLKVRSNVKTDAILADSFEAVIGALYLDAGLEKTAKWITALFKGDMMKDKMPPSDDKTQLQEYVQGKGMPLPEYRTVSAEGPDHDPIFTIEVSASGKKAEGKGNSKRTAEQKAAKALLKELKSAK